MAVAADTTTVTGAQSEIKDVLAAGATRTLLILNNLSGAPVDLFVGAETIPFKRMDGGGEGGSLQLTGNVVQLAFKAVCESGPLTLRCTESTG